VKGIIKNGKEVRIYPKATETLREILSAITPVGTSRNINKNSCKLSRNIVEAGVRPLLSVR
jgi:hypothetical protein